MGGVPTGTGVRCTSSCTIRYTFVMDTHNEHASASSARVRRDRQATEQRLIEATIQLIREHGFDGVGINAIAETAGVSKVLIYRYFGDMAGLLRAVAESIRVIDPDLARGVRESAPADATPGTLVARTTHVLRGMLADNEFMRNVLVWELSQDNELTTALAESRERIGLEQTRQFTAVLKERRPDETLDTEALFALLTAGVFYLSLRSERCRVFNGVDLQSEQGWNRIAGVVQDLLDREPKSVD